VSTHTAGIPELVKQGENGWLVPAGDLESLTEALIELMATAPSDLRRMGMCGRQRVEKQHNSIAEGEVLERLLQACSR